MKLTREELRLNYNEACNAYLMAFCEKHGFDYADAARSWVGGDVGGITECADYIVRMDDIITDIDMDAPEDEYAKYYNYCLRVHSIANGELMVPNYDNWLRGCPRMDEDGRGADQAVGRVAAGHPERRSESESGGRPVEQLKTRIE